MDPSHPPATHTYTPCVRVCLMSSKLMLSCWSVVGVDAWREGGAPWWSMEEEKWGVRWVLVSGWWSSVTPSSLHFPQPAMERLLTEFKTSLNTTEEMFADRSTCLKGPWYYLHSTCALAVAWSLKRLYFFYLVCTWSRSKRDISSQCTLDQNVDLVQARYQLGILFTQDIWIFHD